MNLFINFDYKDLSNSVTLPDEGSRIAFSGLSGLSDIVIWSNLLYRYDFFECDIITDVSEQNDDISTSTSGKYHKTSVHFEKDIRQGIWSDHLTFYPIFVILHCLKYLK